MATNFANQTIIAQCTPKGSGALALLRLSGGQALPIATQIGKLASGTQLTEVNSHTIHFGYVIDQYSKTIDQVMFIVMKAPKTFTGEDIVEITCHNNPFIIEEIITQAIRYGARLAQQGEFAKRAFLHGKIDLVQAEAIQELIQASTQQALKKSLAQLEGSFSYWMQGIEKQLMHCLALSEASFEFLDDEIEFGQQITEIIKQVLIQVETIKKTFSQQQQIKEGIRIALIGSVNAGKSSLFNLLVGKNRAIVTDIAGTTRDTLEAGMHTKEAYITYVDTAGIRQTDDIIEQEGIRRSFEEAAKADIILLIFDGSRELTAQEQAAYKDIFNQYAKKIICVCAKWDMVITKLPVEFIQSIAISTQTKEGLNLLEQAIQDRIANLLSHHDSPFLLNQRHYSLLLSLETYLLTIQQRLNMVVDYELLSINIKEALETITELTGKSVTEQVMDAIFKEFCVGK